MFELTIPLAASPVRTPGTSAPGAPAGGFGLTFGEMIGLPEQFPADISGEGGSTAGDRQDAAADGKSLPDDADSTDLTPDLAWLPITTPLPAPVAPIAPAAEIVPPMQAASHAIAPDTARPIPKLAEPAPAGTTAQAIRVPADSTPITFSLPAALSSGAPELPVALYPMHSGQPFTTTRARILSDLVGGSSLTIPPITLPRPPVTARTPAMDSAGASLIVIADQLLPVQAEPVLAGAAAPRSAEPDAIPAIEVAAPSIIRTAVKGSDTVVSVPVAAAPSPSPVAPAPSLRTDAYLPPASPPLAGLPPQGIADAKIPAADPATAAPIAVDAPQAHDGHRDAQPPRPVQDRPLPQPLPARPLMPLGVDGAAPVILGLGAAAPERRRIGLVEDRSDGLPAVSSPSVTTPKPAVLPVADTQRTPLDMRRDDWTQGMIDRIEAMRDAADARDTRIRLIPDALGKIDVAMRKDGDTVHVHFTADVAATRAMLNEAQPRLVDLAAARGLRLGQTAVDAGGTGTGTGNGQPHHPTPHAAHQPGAPVSAATAEPSEDTRLA